MTDYPPWHNRQQQGYGTFLSHFMEEHHLTITLNFLNVIYIEIKLSVLLLCHGIV